MEKKIGDMVKAKIRDKEADMSIVYKIPCVSCRKFYIGKNGEGNGNQIGRT